MKLDRILNVFWIVSKLAGCTFEGYVTTPSLQKLTVSFFVSSAYCLAIETQERVHWFQTPSTSSGETEFKGKALWNLSEHPQVQNFV